MEVLGDRNLVSSHTGDSSGAFDGEVAESNNSILLSFAFNSSNASLSNWLLIIIPSDKLLCKYIFVDNV